MPLPKQDHCTYADYCAWDTVERYELFDGVPVLQARPSIAHQAVEGAILQQLRNFLEGKPCKAFAEIEVLLPNSQKQTADDVPTVLVPDITVICDPDQLREQYCFGAPTVVMEVLSPSTAKADRLVKLNTYQRAGVPEYWIVSPQEQTVQVFLLQDGIYQTHAVYTAEEVAKVESIQQCFIELVKVFA